MSEYPMPPVAPVEGANRPLWSVMIPVHNCADLLRHALGGVVEQVGGRDDVQIEVIDDNSSDDPEAVVRTVGGAAVSYIRLPEPSGAIGNFNECLRRSRGTYVHVLHGDDGVLPGFYAAMEAALKDEAIGAACCRTEYIDASGSARLTSRSERRGSGPWHDAATVLATSNRIRPSSIVARRSVYEGVGGFRQDLPHAADWEMWMRIAVATNVWFEDRTLAQYRTHDANDTSRRVRTGDNIRERVVAIDMVVEHLPAPARAAARRKALLYSAVFAGRTALHCARRRQFGPASRQLAQSVMCAVRAGTLAVP
jgi:glycosyltransferase involved in cell wall biosynthesis